VIQSQNIQTYKEQIPSENLFRSRRSMQDNSRKVSTDERRDSSGSSQRSRLTMRENSGTLRSIYDSKIRQLIDKKEVYQSASPSKFTRVKFLDLEPLQ
jgi:hypothetical protein